MSLLLFASLCFVLVETVIAQCSFPNQTNFAGVAASIGGPLGFGAQFQVLCVTISPEIDTYRTSVVSGELPGFDFPFVLVEAVCSPSGEWMEADTEFQEMFVEGNLTQPCSTCSLARPAGFLCSRE